MKNIMVTHLKPNHYISKPNLKPFIILVVLRQSML